MKVVVVYESMFGNTKAIAESIARSLTEISKPQLICVADGDMHLPEDVELLVVGGPTHAWSMSRPNTRRSAPGYSSKPNSGLVLQSGADQAMGVREWLAAQAALPISAAAFDTRIKGPWLLTGRASRSIAKALGRHGAHLVVRPESFLVDRSSHLVAGEEARAEAWARQVASVIGRGDTPSQGRAPSNA